MEIGHAGSFGLLGRGCAKPFQLFVRNGSWQGECFDFLGVPPEPFGVREVKKQPLDAGDCFLRFEERAWQLAGHAEDVLHRLSRFHSGDDDNSRG